MLKPKTWQIFQEKNGEAWHSLFMSGTSRATLWKGQSDIKSTIEWAFHSVQGERSCESLCKSGGITEGCQGEKKGNWCLYFQKEHLGLFRFCYCNTYTEEIYCFEVYGLLAWHPFTLLCYLCHLYHYPPPAFFHLSKLKLCILSSNSMSSHPSLCKPPSLFLSLQILFF